MALWKSMVITVFVIGILVYDSSATVCSSESDCLEFEHCCKGNCTSKQLHCHSICSHDIHCDSHKRCALGLCVNCTDEISCDKKSCLNDTHCPSTHSCNENACLVKKEKDLTSEMVPFLIFISALSVSLLIVCYNDYILERLGHRNCTECIDRTLCNCSLILRIWMWRHRRSQARNTDGSCPVVEVQFDSRIFNPSNTFNEKQETSFSLSLNEILDRLMFWRRFNRSSQANCSIEEENVGEESHEISTPTDLPSVVLLNESMNTNEDSNRRTSVPDLNTNSGVETTNNSLINQQDQNMNENHPCSFTVPNLSEDTKPSTSRSSGDLISNVNIESSSSSTDCTSITTSSRLVTTV